MANKRMFSVDVVETDAFLDLPPKVQALYFHLGMRRSLCQQLDEEFHRCEWVQIIKQATRQGWLKFYPLDKDRPTSAAPELESTGSQIDRVLENLKRKNGVI